MFLAFQIKLGWEDGIYTRFVVDLLPAMYFEPEASLVAATDLWDRR